MSPADTHDGATGVVQYRIGKRAGEFRDDTGVVCADHDELGQADVVREVFQHPVADWQGAHGHIGGICRELGEVAVESHSYRECGIGGVAVVYPGGECEQRGSTQPCLRHRFVQHGG